MIFSFPPFRGPGLPRWRLGHFPLSARVCPPVKENFGPAPGGHPGASGRAPRASLEAGPARTEAVSGGTWGRLPTRGTEARWGEERGPSGLPQTPRRTSRAPAGCPGRPPAVSARRPPPSAPRGGAGPEPGSGARVAGWGERGGGGRGSPRAVPAPEPGHSPASPHNARPGSGRRGLAARRRPAPGRPPPPTPPLGRLPRLPRLRLLAARDAPGRPPSGGDCVRRAHFRVPPPSGPRAPGRRRHRTIGRPSRPPWTSCPARAGRCAAPRAPLRAGRGAASARRPGRACASGRRASAAAGPAASTLSRRAGFTPAPSRGCARRPVSDFDCLRRGFVFLCFFFLLRFEKEKRTHGKLGR